MSGSASLNRAALDELDRNIAAMELVRSANKKWSNDVNKALIEYDNVLRSGQSKFKKDWGDWHADNIGNEKGGLYISTLQDILESVYLRRLFRKISVACRSRLAPLISTLSSSISGYLPAFTFNFSFS